MFAVVHLPMLSSLVFYTMLILRAGCKIESERSWKSLVSFECAYVQLTRSM